MSMSSVQPMPPTGLWSWLLEVFLPFTEEVARAIEELLELAVEQPVALACSTSGEFDRAVELLAQAAGEPSREVPEGIEKSIKVERRHVHRGFNLFQ